MLTIFWRKDPTTDEIAKKYLNSEQLKRAMDTVFYKDEEGKIFYARLPFDFSGHPTRRTKTIVLNCYRWKLEPCRTSINNPMTISGGTDS